MNIKIQEKDRTVVFGEIDHVEWSEIKGDAPIQPGTIQYEPGNSHKEKRHMELSFFTKNMTEATLIRCYSPIYLMNDNGKTIEII